MTLTATITRKDASTYFNGLMNDVGSSTTRTQVFDDEDEDFNDLINVDGYSNDGTTTISTTTDSTAILRRC